MNELTAPSPKITEAHNFKINKTVKKYILLQTLTAMFVSLLHEQRSTSNKITATLLYFYTRIPVSPALDSITACCGWLGSVKDVSTVKSRPGENLHQQIVRQEAGHNGENRWKNQRRVHERCPFMGKMPVQYDCIKEDRLLLNDNKFDTKQYCIGIITC